MKWTGPGSLQLAFERGVETITSRQIFLYWSEIYLPNEETATKVS